MNERYLKYRRIESGIGKLLRLFCHVMLFDDRRHWPLSPIDKFEMGLVFKKLMRLCIYTGALPIMLVLVHHRDVILGCSGVHKLVMPAAYELTLPAGEYQIWNFCEWPSKQIHGHPKLLDIAIESSHRGPRTNTTGAVEFTRFRDYENLKLARPSDSAMVLNICKAGKFKISSPNICVVVIVPKREVTYGLYAHGFMGENDDLNFDFPLEDAVSWR